MPKKANNIKNVRRTMEKEVITESKKLANNRTYRFKQILGKDWPDENILSLVESGVDYWDLEKLVNKGCSPELAIQILI